MIRHERVARWVAAAIAVAAVATAVVATAVVAARADAPVEIAIHWSRYTPGTVEARVDRPLVIVLRNDDPIDHEWIVGDDALHARHRTGTEPVHASRPTEVTIPAGEVRRTTIVFDRPGTYRFVCHLPGHEAYGMVGTLVVRP